MEEIASSSSAACFLPFRVICIKARLDGIKASNKCKCAGRRREAVISFKFLAPRSPLVARAQNARKYFLISPQERFDRSADRSRSCEVFLGIKIRRNVSRVLRLFTAKGMPLPGSYEFFRCRWERQGWKQSSGERREAKERRVYLGLSGAAAVKFNVALPS